MCSFWLHNSKPKASQLLLKSKPIPRQEEQLTLLTFLLKKNSNQQSLISADSRSFMKPDSNSTKYSQLCINFGFRGANLDIYVSNKHLIPSTVGMLAIHLHIEWDFSQAALLGPEKLLGSVSLLVGRAESTRREILEEDTEHALGKTK